MAINAKLFQNTGGVNKVTITSPNRTFIADPNFRSRQTVTINDITGFNLTGIHDGDTITYDSVNQSFKATAIGSITGAASFATESYANSAFLNANSAFVRANTAYTLADNAYVLANNSYQISITSGSYANSSYELANTVFQNIKNITGGNF